MLQKVILKLCFMLLIATPVYAESDQERWRNDPELRRRAYEQRDAHKYDHSYHYGRGTSGTFRFYYYRPYHYTYTRPYYYRPYRCR